MTVAQLIAALQKMPQNYPVYMAFYWSSGIERYDWPSGIERHDIKNVENCEPTATLDHRVELSWTCSMED